MYSVSVDVIATFSEC